MPGRQLRVQIITQERELYDQPADMVIARGIEGEMGILPQHSPLVTPLDFGEVRVKRGDQEETFAVGGGVLRVAHDHVIILAESAESAHEIDLARAEEARKRAHTMMEHAAQVDPAQRAAIEAAIKRANLRLKVGTRRRRRAPGGGAPIDMGARD